tara:strand:+ start:400 stop:648 length:249 start_codon:yes stop_codon:yes gene_type:complete
MKIAVDISFYPLNEEFVTPIKDFISRIKEYEKVEIFTNSMSTQIRGEYHEVINALTVEMYDSFNNVPKSVFAIKILNNPLSD